MNRTCLVLVIVAMSSATFLAPQICIAQQRKKPKSCWDTAMTQLAMNECAGSELKAAQTRMAALLKKLSVTPDDPAQKAWEAYRDAQLEAIYPREGTPGYGSVFPMCFAILKTDLTEGRIRDLKALTRLEKEMYVTASDQWPQGEITSFLLPRLIIRGLRFIVGFQAAVQPREKAIDLKAYFCTCMGMSYT